MGGRASKQKGSRAEYQIRDILRDKGWTADRVPMSGAAQGFKGDVKATKEGRTLLVEVKSRQDEYKNLYVMLDNTPALVLTGLNTPTGCIAIGYDLEVVLNQTRFTVIPDPKYVRTIRKIVTMKKLLGEAELLAVKINNKPFIYIKYV